LTDDVTRAAELLVVQRGHIDNLDAILIYTLAERFKATQAVGALKASHDLPASDPSREIKQIERLLQLAEDANLDPDFTKKFLSFIISEVIRHHEQQQK
jgi:chorismate mutase